MISEVDRWLAECDTCHAQQVCSTEDQAVSTLEAHERLTGHESDLS